MNRHKRNTSQRLARNTASLSLTQVGRVGFNTILSLLVARQLGAEGFGKYTVLLAYMNIFQVLAMMGVPRLAIREMARRPDQNQRWFQTTLANQLLGAGGGAVLLVLVAHVLHHPPDTTQAVGIVALALFPFAVSSAAEAAFQAKEQMGFIALAQLTAGAVQVAGSILVLLAGYGVVGLAWMLVVGQCVVAGLEIGITVRMGLWRGFGVNLKEAALLFKQSFDFFLMALSVVIFSRLDVLILSQLMGEKAVGVYNAAYLIIRVITFLSSSYSDASYPVLSRLFAEAHERFKLLLRKSLLFGTTVNLLVAILLVVCAQPIVGLLYRGQEYTVSVLVLRIEAPFVVIFVWNALLSNGLMAGNMQNRSALVSGVKLGLGLIYYVALTAWLGTIGTAIATVLAGFTGTTLNYYFVNRDIFSLNPIELVGKPLAIGAVLAALLWVVRGWAWPWQALGAALFYAAWLGILRVFTGEDIRLLRRTVWPLKEPVAE